MNTHHTPDGGHRPASPDGVFEPGRVEILPKIIWSCIRGRLALTAALALVLGVGLAGAGYMSTRPSYTSEGKVRIAPSPVAILYQNDMNEITPYFLDFVKTEATRLRGGRVYELALEDPALHEIGLEPGPRGSMELARAISVDFPVGQVISLRATHPDQAKSQVMLNSVMRAYLRLQDEEIQRKADRIAVPLADRERDLRGVYGEALGRFDELVSQHGSRESVGRRLDVLDAEILKLQTERRESTADYDLLGRRVAQRTDDITRWNGKLMGEGGAEVGPTPEALSIADGRLEALLEERGAMTKQIEFELEQGLLISHPAIIRLQNQIELTDSLIDRRMASLVDQWWAAFGVGTADLSGRRARLERSIADIDVHLGELAGERAKVATLHQQIGAEYDRVTRAQDRLQLVIDRREEVGLELQTDGDSRRLGQAEILAWGDLPLLPSRDSRRLRAVAGLVAGTCMGFGLVVAFGMARRRVRYTSELADSGLGVPLMGSLPVLERGVLASPKKLGELAHQLRTVVELRTEGDGAGVHAVTSSTVGEGKSTLAVALAASYAASGQRTLLVDADTAGGAITHRFGIETRTRGFVESIREPNTELPTVPSGVAGLDILPVGGGADTDLPACSLGKVEAFFARLRHEYDRVVVDTGVLAGSAEAALSCRAADAILFVVGRGQSRNELEGALARFGELGLGCVGLIFNRAEAHDSARYTSMPAAFRAGERSHTDTSTDPAVARAYS
ncbi:MAG: hypothetical protein DHS20C14_13270 [Phycisphaeraceae bacterium]|nr:MAG: hypothetical protein DHS20C14_13270 [Phycisphaeraceae bacterium]